MAEGSRSRHTPYAVTELRERLAIRTCSLFRVSLGDNVWRAAATRRVPATLMRPGGGVVWDAAKLRATNCPEAERFLRREYRKGWSLG
jgi:hypothetical protein